MKKLVVVVLVAVALVAGLVWMGSRARTAKQPINVAQILPVRIIEDVVIQTATKNWLERVANEWDADMSGAAFAARQAKYAYDLLPKFGNEAKLYDATYAVYSDSGSGTEWRLKEAGLPISTIGFLSSYRETLFSHLRNQLKDPKTLQQFYQEKKPLILAEIAKRPELKEKVLDFLRSAGNAFGDTAAGHPKMGGDKYVVAFAQRRMAEGGDKLVWAYCDAVDDLYHSIK